jgi:hypothetical protein
VADPLPATPAATVARMRRTLSLLAGVVLALGACGDDGAGGGGSAALEPGTPATVEVALTGPQVPVRVTGTLESTEDGWVVCPGSVAPCWPVIDASGVDLVEGPTVVEGTWQADTISLLSIDALDDPAPDFVDPCEGDDLGRWNAVPGGTTAIEAATPQVAGIWLTRDQQTLVVVVTDAVEEVRARLADEGFEGVCVADLGFEHTFADLEATQDAMAGHLVEWGDQGWVAISLDIDVTRNVVIARFDEIDQRLRSEVEERWSTVVAIEASVEVLEGTVDDLTLPLSDREIPVATQPRGAAGMDALGRFTLRYDAEADCLWLEPGDGGRVKPIWPAGTRALRDPFVVLDGRGDPVVAIGQEIETGGGFGQVLPDSDDPTDCGATDVWVFNPY